MMASSSDLPPPDYVGTLGNRIAFRRVKGNARGLNPTIVFLPGYASDMQGSKALALEAWAIRTRRGLVRLDYSGCGESDGAFEEGTLTRWRDDALRVIGLVERGPLILVGSSMGGWIALLLALALGDQVKGLIGIAAAPDFTDWGFTSEEKGKLERHGRLERPSDYGPEPMVTTRAFWKAGQDHLLLSKTVGISCPVRLLQGQRDDAVPWETALHLSEQLCSDDVQVTLIKDGDHRLSRDADIALLIATLEGLLDAL
jgi:pimeloyl-ACP methyl ester carboxylesterase